MSGIARLQHDCIFYMAVDHAASKCLMACKPCKAGLCVVGAIWLHLGSVAPIYCFTPSILGGKMVIAT